MAEDKSTCLVCSATIDDSSEDSVFCDGSCQGWIHRRCAGLPKAGFKSLSESDVPFFCAMCSSVKIHQLLQSVSDLQSEICVLKSVPNVSSPTHASSYSSVVVNGSLGGHDDINPSSGPVIDNTINPVISPNSSPSSSHPPDHRFNVVFYGITENPKGSPHHTRLVEDCKNVAAVASKMVESVSSQSIKDCVRLGKYSVEKCRPILVKFTHTCDVSSLLRNRNKLKDCPGVHIKPDMSPAERKTDLILMAKRWELLQSGTHKNRTSGSEVISSMLNLLNLGQLLISS